MKALLIILLLLSSCSISQADLDFTWYRMQQEYHSDKPMPNIVYLDKRNKNCDGFPVRGIYNTEVNIIYLYQDYTYDTIIHEMHHAMGDDLGEYAIIPFNGGYR